MSSPETDQQDKLLSKAPKSIPFYWSPKRWQCFRKGFHDTVAIIVPLLPTKSFALHLVSFRKYNNLKSRPHVKQNTNPQTTLKPRK
jgi:hypothetical protein